MDGRIQPRIARTRQKVLDAANELLEELGFGRVTVEHVSARSGVSRSTMYRHWRSLDDILRDAFSARALGPDDDGAGLLEAFRTYARAFAHGLEHVWGVAAATLSVSALTDPAQRAVQQVFVSGYRRDVATLLARARRRGEVGADVDVDAVVVDLIAPLFYAFLFDARPLTPEVADAAARRAHAAATAPPATR